MKRKHFANWLKSWMGKLKVSDRQLGILSGLEHASIGQYRRGERLPRISSFIYLCEAISKESLIPFPIILLEAALAAKKDI
jgi:transcriptional regulator with XRE-family HTH domain